MNANRSMLVVDDELEACRNLSDIFSELGYRVDTATSAEDALSKARRQSFDVALLDLMLPNDDGVSLFEQLRSLQPEILGCVITAHPQHPKLALAHAAGVARVFAKPVDMSHLIQMLIPPASNAPATC